MAASGFGGRNPRYRNFAPLEESIVRGTVVWEPTDRFTAKLKANYVHSDVQGDGGGLQFCSCPEGTSSAAGVPFLAGEDCKLDEVVRIVDLDPAAFPRVRNGGTPFSDAEQHFGTLELVLGRQITGGTTSGPAGVDELGCNVEPGREVWIRLTVKPLAFRQ